jgi:hypothetical protein
MQILSHKKLEWDKRTSLFSRFVSGEGKKRVYNIGMRMESDIPAPAVAMLKKQ